jgi:hypothetical protein
MRILPLFSVNYRKLARFTVLGGLAGALAGELGWMAVRMAEATPWQTPSDWDEFLTEYLLPGSFVDHLRYEWLNSEWQLRPLLACLFGGMAGAVGYLALRAYSRKKAPPAGG